MGQLRVVMRQWLRKSREKVRRGLRVLDCF